MSDKPVEAVQGDVPSKSAPKKVIWKILRGIGWLVAGFAVLVAAVAVFLDTQAGHRFIIDRVAGLEIKSGLRIEIGRIDGSIYRRAILNDIRLYDAEGAFLEVPQVKLNWRPYSWAYNVLDIRDVEVLRGRLLKAPKLLPTESDNGLLPGFDIRIDRFVAKDFVVEEAVAGDRRVIQLAGEALIRSGRVLIDLNSQMGGGDRLAVLVDAVPDDDRLDIDIDVAAPEGGVLLAVTGFQRPFTFRAVGKGKWSNWEGAAAIRSAGQLLAATKIYAESGDYRLIGQAYPVGPLAGLPKQLASPAMDIVLKGRLDEARTFDGSLTLVTPALTANGEGKVNLRNLEFDRFVVALAGGRRALLKGVEFAKFGGLIELNGTPSNLTADYQLGAQKMSAINLQFARPSLSGTAHRYGKRLTIPIHFRHVGLKSKSPEVERLMEGTNLNGALVLDQGQITSSGLKITGKLLNGSLAASGNTGAAGIKITGNLSARNYPVRNIGLTDLDGDISFGFGAGKPWHLEGDVTAKLVRSDNRTLDTFAGIDVRGFTHIDQVAGSNLRLTNTRLTGSRIALAGGGQRFPDGVVRLNGTGRHMSYGDLQFGVDFAREGPRLQLLLDRPVPALGVRDVRLSLVPIEGGFGADATGNSLLGPFSGKAQIFSAPREPTRIVLDNFKVTDTHVDGTLYTSQDGLSGRLALSGGGLDGSVAISPGSAGTSVRADVVARNAVFDGAVPIRITTADINLTALLAEGKSDLDGRVNAAGITAGRFFIGRVVASGSMNDGKGRITASIAGRRGSRFELQTLTDFAPDTISFRAEGEYSGRRIRMPAPARLTRSGEQWQLQPAQISFGRRASIVGSGSFGEGQTDLRFQMSRMPLSLADIAYADLGLGGTASGVVTYSKENGEAPTGTARIQVAQLSRSGLALTSRPVDLSVNAALTRTALAMRGVLMDDDTSLGRFQARISDLPPGNALATRLEAGRLFAQLRYNGPADALWRLSGVEGFDFTGPVRIAADMTGNIADPSVRGTISTDDAATSVSGETRLSRASLESTLSGMQISNVSARGTFEGSKLTVRRFTGRAKNGGTVAGSGTVDLAGLRGVAMNLKVHAENALLVDRDDVGAAVTGDIAIVSSGSGGVLRSVGKLQINSGRFRLGQAVAAEELPRIAYREINRRADEQTRTVRTSPWRYDIKAAARNKLTVTGLGLDSEWRADIALQGQVDEPQITGTADLVRGGYQFAGRRFELDRGNIRFQGQFPPNPLLDIRAIASVSDINATILVGGSGQRPEITFSSVPSLPEEEVLSRLLFGSSITDISAPEAVQLASAVASLRGGSGLDPINQLRSAIGLDRLRIVSADVSTGQETGVAAGKYITRRVYAEIVTDGRGYSATNIEYQITRWLSILGSISTIGRENANVRISKDY